MISHIDAQTAIGINPAESLSGQKRPQRQCAIVAAAQIGCYTSERPIRDTQIVKPRVNAPAKSSTSSVIEVVDDVEDSQSNDSTPLSPGRKSIVGDNGQIYYTHPSSMRKFRKRPSELKIERQGRVCFGRC